MKANNEKRKFERIDNEFSVRITKNTEKGGIKELSIDLAESINISGSGLLINIKEPIETGTQVRVMFLKPNSFDIFDCNGKVVRIDNKKEKSHSVGIDFIGLSDSDKEKLNYYITL